ncbi:MAG: hypothetical protein N4A44_04765 [Alphaproteobacteria bacterium]|jgi:hypothetical protein|nr:hypothetical protein [Alphaproteobacteria bacterium]
MLKKFRFLSLFILFAISFNVVKVNNAFANSQCSEYHNMPLCVDYCTCSPLDNKWRCAAYTDGIRPGDNYTIMGGDVSHLQPCISAPLELCPPNSTSAFTKLGKACYCDPGYKNSSGEEEGVTDFEGGCTEVLTLICPDHSAQDSSLGAGCWCDVGYQNDSGELRGKVNQLGGTCSPVPACTSPQTWDGSTMVDGNKYCTTDETCGCGKENGTGPQLYRKTDVIGSGVICCRNEKENRGGKCMDPITCTPAGFGQVADTSGCGCN